MRLTGRGIQSPRLPPVWRISERRIGIVGFGLQHFFFALLAVRVVRAHLAPGQALRVVPNLGARFLGWVPRDPLPLHRQELPVSTGRWSSPTRIPRSWRAHVRRSRRWEHVERRPCLAARPSPPTGANWRRVKVELMPSKSCKPEFPINVQTAAMFRTGALQW